MALFLKENWFKVGILLIAIIAVLLYFRSAERSKSLANNIRCLQEGSQLLARMRKESPGSLLYSKTYSNPEFLFSSILNTCLMKGFVTIANDAGFSFNYFIKDVYTNKELAEYTSWEDITGEIAFVGEEEFEHFEKEYFPE